MSFLRGCVPISSIRVCHQSSIMRFHSTMYSSRLWHFGLDQRRNKTWETTTVLTKGWFVFVKGGGARVMAASEMPRPCVRNVVQAQGKPPVSKSSLTCAHSCGQYFVKSIRTVTTQDQSQKAKRDDCDNMQWRQSLNCGSDLHWSKRAKCTFLHSN